MLPGDIIAFAGEGGFSSIIQGWTEYPVSHVGIILERSGPYNLIMESTSLNGKSGVCINRMSDRVRNYEGKVWHLPLSSEVRKNLDLDKFWAFLHAQDGEPYDTWGAVKSALDWLDGTGLTYNREDYAALFCSELATAGLDAGDAITDINCSEVHPRNLVEFALYFGQYYQLKGEWTELPGYNTVDPEGFGV